MTQSGLVWIWLTAATRAPSRAAFPIGVEGEDRSPDLEDPKQDQHQDREYQRELNKSLPAARPALHGPTVIDDAQSSTSPGSSDCVWIV